VPGDIEVLSQTRTNTNLKLLAARADVDRQDLGAFAFDFDPSTLEMVGTPHLGSGPGTISFDTFDGCIELLAQLEAPCHALDKITAAETME
jgi:hypothetical protein